MMPAKSTPNLHNREPTVKQQNLYSYLQNQQSLSYGSAESAAATPRDESPPPAPPVRDSSTLKSIKYGPGHEKFPSWPVPAAAETPQALRNPPGGGSHRSKSWTDHTNYPKEKVVAYSRPYMKKQHSTYTQQKLKTVMEKCEKIPPETYESRFDKVKERIFLPQVDHDGKTLGDMNYAVPSPPERDVAMKSQLTQEDLEHYTRIYNQEPIQFNLNEDRRSSHQHQHLTQSGLEQFMEYNKNYEDSLFNSMSSKSDESILTHLHQKQLSYAQSEGYHSYVSSTDSTATPFLDRLRKDSHAVVRSSSWDEAEQDQNLRHEGRDSVVTTSSGSASSSETLKWLGSISDVSVASSSCTHLANSSVASSRQLIAHSARVQIPQRHHSESVLYISSESQDVWKDKESRNNNTNKLKLFALNTYTVQEKDVNTSSSSNRSSLQSMPSIADRISELEKQQKYSYLDPDKKHKIPDPTLKAIQKKALLSFYERHHTNSTKNNSWRSEPQLAQSQATFAVPQPPPRIKVQIPSRRASSASDYASGTNSKRSSMASRESKMSESMSKITPKHQHSNSCGSLSTDLLGPIIVGPSISLDDWVPKGPPERPPKNPQLRNAFPELFNDHRMSSPDLPPPSPPTVLEDEVFNCDDPLPPPPPECDQDFNRPMREAKSQGQFAGPQVRNTKAESPIRQTVGLPENNGSFMSVGCRSIKTRPTEQIFHQVSSKPYNVMSPDKNKNDSSLAHSSQKSYAERSDTKYPTTQKLVLNGMGNIAISQNVSASKQFPTPLRPKMQEKRSTGDIQRRSSLADSSDNPPPLQPRQMRINQSMRVSSSHDRNYPLRSSPPKDMRDVRSSVRSQSKASVLASRRDRDRVVPDSDTGSYKRTMSPNGHAIPAEVLSESPKINARETMWPVKTKKELQKNNNNNNNSSNIFRRVSMNEKPNKSKSFKCDENEDLKKASLVLPDVLPVHALTNRSHYGRTSYQFTTLEDGDASKSPPSSPSKSPPRGSPFAPLKATTLSSTTSFSDRVSPPTSRGVTTPVSASSVNTPLRVATYSTVETSSPVTTDAPKPESPKLSPLSTKTTTQSGVSTSPSFPSRTSPQIKQQLSPSSPMKLSPLRISPASSTNNSPLQTPTSNSAQHSPPLSPEKPESCPPVIEGLQMIQRTEIVLRVNTTTSDASSQTEKEELPPTPLPTRKKLQEEIDCDLLSEDIISQLSSSDKLKDILVPGPTHKKLSDYVQGLFKPEVTSRPRPVNSPFRSRCDTPNDTQPSSLSPTNGTTVKPSVPSSNNSVEMSNSLSGNSAYFTTSEPKARFLTRYCQDINQSSLSRSTKDLNQKKEELVNRLGKKLDVLKTEQEAVEEESRINEELGQNVESHISRVARPQEAAKFRLHVAEIGKITSLLLGISGRLARAENALIGMAEDHNERRTLEAKRDKLQSQLEEAKSLKECIDRRSVNVSNILTKYLDTDGYADYDHFINMKAKLIMDSKEIADKIKLGEEQLMALKESLTN
ncbi:protein Shroom [Harmonia axyridis]|uniref:protein Shroom n=1 Tax=Harmonia axyridis TaxID=115357 RepID=UPI001E276D79|nr:protein Shroom [Harmonia axyridis]XP_045464054.1 protein Shroom [Harmonia axyridis]XP_045464056.1 protein Shroom [Harmonia axyridis]XP_045464057.1 protein Shroom [Harmonia axyridis]XP_045464058.1 protein Shroom [Harmonia axyridis]